MSTTVYSAKTFFFLALCAFSLVSFPFFVYAQTGDEPVLQVEAFEMPYEVENLPGGGAIIGDFVVGPGKVDEAITPGETKVVQMTISNRTGETRKFKITIEDAAGSKNTETSVVLLGDDRGPYSLRDYISVPHEEFELGHNQRAIVPVTISIPADAEPGGLYGSVLAETISREAVAGDGISSVPQSAIIARIGTLFFITVPGEIERSGGLSDFSTIPKRSYFGSGPITFGLLYENNANMHLAPYGEIRLHNILGEEVGFVELEPWFVLPDSLRLREVTWNRELLFGRYTATANINRSYNDVIDSRTITFWVLPWKPLTTGLVIVFVVIFLIRAFFRTFEFKRKIND